MPSPFRNLPAVESLVQAAERCLRPGLSPDASNGAPPRDLLVEAARQAMSR